MLKQDKFYTGMIAAILISSLAYFALEWIDESLRGTMIGNRNYFGVRQQFLIILAVVSNLIPFNYYSRTGRTNAMRGTALVTLLEGTAVVIYIFA